ncbi:hypothetical protein D3C87_1761100 [compost metagenome]
MSSSPSCDTVAVTTGSTMVSRTSGAPSLSSSTMASGETLKTLRPGPSGRSRVFSQAAVRIPNFSSLKKTYQGNIPAAQARAMPVPARNRSVSIDEPLAPSFIGDTGSSAS